jgi:hypothetical protein
MQAIKAINKTMMEVKEELSRKCGEKLSEATLTELARETGFVQRSSSRLKGKEYVELLTVYMLDDAGESLEGLCDTLGQRDSSKKMRVQSLSERINQDKSVVFLRRVFEELIKIHLDVNMSSETSEVLKQFNQVLIEDSTSIELNARLASKFKGCGGSASPSSMKIDLIYEYLAHKIYSIAIDSGIKPDQKEQRIVEVLKAGDLVIRDQGYFSVEVFAEIAERLAYFLSRLPSYMSFCRINEYGEFERITHIKRYVDRHFPNHSIIDIEAYMGENKQRCRIVIWTG